MQKRSCRKSSVLDEIRPAQWDVTLSNELRELIWVLEATVDATPALNGLFQRVVSGAVLSGDLLPLPTQAERAAPDEEDEETRQRSLI